MTIDRRDIVQMLRRENELLKARNQKLDARLIRQQQAFRALNHMDESMRSMRSSFDLMHLIHDLLALALHACDSENGSLILMDDDTRKSLLIAYQKRKQDKIMHPFTKERMPIGLVFHTQALLLARYIRGDLDGYPVFLWK